MSVVTFMGVRYMPRVYLSSVIDVARFSVTGVVRVIATRRWESLRAA